MEILPAIPSPTEVWARMCMQLAGTRDGPIYDGHASACAG